MARFQSTPAIDHDKDDDERKRGGLLVHGRKAHAWWERVGWLRWLFGDGGEGAFLVMSGLVIAGVTTAVIYDAVDSIQKSRTVTYTQVVSQASSMNTRAFTVRGQDSWGRRAVFDVLISVKSLGWVRGSTDTLEQDGERFEGSAITERYLDRDVQRRLANARAWIAVGLASQEGDRETETARAGRRAEQTARWIASATTLQRPLYTLNLGQYQAPCAACESDGTSWQRPVIVIGVERMDEGVDLREALMDGFTRARNLPSPESYSSFELEGL